MAKNTKSVNGKSVVVDNEIPFAMQLKVLNSQLGGYKDLLNKSDYKVVKNSEYISAGLDAPYDPVELHEARQSYRDAIVDLEEQIAELQNGD